jgi:membrane-bound metal-dependent hydrolase YbcI (DUF457 family)
MFVGHLGVAFMAKRPCPRPSLATYVLAATLPDFLWSLFVLAGWETVRIVPGETAVTPLRFVHYPYSHSLLAIAGWGALLGGAYWARRGDRTGGLWIAALVWSHWLLDVVSHRPDVPVAPGSELVLGLGLWSSRIATLLVEGGLFAAGVWLYARGTRPVSGAGRLGLGVLVALVGVPWLASLSGTPPPAIGVVAATNLIGGAVTVLLAWWTDRRRAPVAR